MKRNTPPMIVGSGEAQRLSRETVLTVYRWLKQWTEERENRMLSEDEIRNRFTYHAPTPAGVDRHAALSRAFIDVASLVDLTCPDGREKALVLTKLEEAKFWASAAVARNPATR